MKLSILLTLLIGCLQSAEIVKTEKVGSYEFQKFIFDNHAYIRFDYEWNSTSSRIWHDPDCEFCMKKSENWIKNLIGDLKENEE